MLDRNMGWNPERVNIKDGGKKGLATLCISGGRKLAVATGR